MLCLLPYVAHLLPLCILDLDCGSEVSITDMSRFWFSSMVEM